MSINLQLPKLTDLRPRLSVIGVGGAGCNAINNMIAAGLTGVEFIVANTDAQALATSSAEHRIQLGVNLTEGLGAGSKPEIGEAAAEEAIDDLRAQIAGSHMVFIAAGMGGGTGTGAAAVIARTAQELGILTVGIVTKPFLFEGTRRMRIADIGVAELKKHVDTLIVIPNQNLFRVANDRTTFAEAFILADQVLYSGVACIVDLIIKEGLINLDFADVRTVMSGMGTAMMGTGEASGDRRAIMAAEEAIANPLLDDVSLKGARGLLLSISGGRDLTLYEVDEAASRVREEVDPDANIIVGATFDESLGDRVRVSIVASGMMRQSDTTRVPIRPAPSSPEHQVALEAQNYPPQPQPTPEVRPQRPAPGSPTPAPTDDMQRRLSAAIQSPEPDPNLWQAPPLWQAPGDVTIEEAPAPRREPQPVAQPSTQARPADPAATFTPEMPTEIRRAPRRMPELEEFPPVAQREYRARAPHGSDKGQQEVVSARRPGLFERLAGLGRRPDDSREQRNSGTHQAVSSRASRAQPDSAPRPRTQPGADRGPQAPSGEVPQSAEIPEFLSRDRR
jgi:cell division protein FtsZ